ncbi:hypothetical protein HELRODRAFT_188265 [Helobdella robusta]|uniref:Vps16 C-terminal domain-containing protein n=1 Tax=Helobdella robusta TaxID=6412 RepID=T1FPT6_HELRO|nr:hypothetical protein HELRODRAFT_188265 [Helobdella robusta]ESO06112.1 hypothetical protein HELRODRAFT_188265 [Helobdella robusta]
MTIEGGGSLGGKSADIFNLKLIHLPEALLGGMSFNPKILKQLIVKSMPYSLECYKSREHKLELLNEAIKTGDGNAILTIVLFLERTMKKSLFNLEIGRRPMALDHYIHHLLGEEPSNNMFDVLKFFSRSDNAAMLKFKLATKDSNASSKVASLKKCLESHFHKEETLQQEAYVVQQYIDLIELQCAIQENYRNEKNISNPVTPKISDGFVGSATMSTLSYSCLYHYDKPENFFVSPLSIKKSQKLTDKQYLWKAMIALIIQKRWNDLESLFKTKTWMGGIKMRSPVSFDRIVSLLHHMNAPKEIKEKYCLLVEDLDQRIQIASKCSCHEIVLKTYKDQLNRCQIEEYMTLLKNNTPEYFFANELLNDTSIKWKK